MQEVRRDRTRKEILTAAADIIKNEGYEKITVRHLGQLTGLSHTVFYHYFKNLNGLLAALRLEMIEDMVSQLGGEPSQTDDQMETLIKSFTDYADYYIKNPNVFRFFYFYPFSDLQKDMESSSLEIRFQSMWQESFAGLVREGILSEEDVFTVAKTIIYSISGMLLLAFTSSATATKPDIENEIRQTIQFLLRKGV